MRDPPRELPLLWRVSNCREGDREKSKVGGSGRERRRRRRTMREAKGTCCIVTVHAEISDVRH